MMAVPLGGGASEALLVAQPVADEPVSKQAVAPNDAVPAEAAAAPVAGSSWFLSAGIVLWQLRTALLSGSVSATVHFATVIVLAVLHAPPFVDRSPPSMPLDATVAREPRQ